MAGPRNAAALSDLSFENKLWQAAAALRASMDAAEHKRVILDLIFLKYISTPSKNSTPN